MTADDVQLASENPEVLTLADVLTRIEQSTALDHRMCREMASAIRKFCTVLDTDPAVVEAHPRHLRGLFAKLTPAMAGVGNGRWTNIRSLVLKALLSVGVKAMPGRSRVPHHPAWEVLRAQLPDRHWQSGLSRLMSFCSLQGVTPEMISPTTFTAFGAAIESESMRDPGGAYRDTCRLWNVAVDTVNNWPQVRAELPIRRIDFSVPIETFPHSFAEDLDRFLHQSSNSDVFSDDFHAPVRPLTARNRRQNIMMAATALLRSGVAAETITDLTALVEINHAKAALSFLYARADGNTTGHLYQIATLLKTVARHYARLDDEVVLALSRQAARLKPPKEGMTEKNLACLRQFTDEAKLASLLLLPEKIFSEALRRDDGLRRTAARVVFALATAIELELPLRAENLIELRLDQHLHYIGDRVILSFNAEDTKNANRIESELSAPLVRLLDCFLKRFRGRLSDARGPYLFPSPNGGLRPSGGFGQQLSGFLAEEAGIVMTFHQFRHLAAKLYLDRVPGDFETVRLLLGHKDIATTMRFYRQIDSILATQRYNSFLTEKLEEARSTAQKHPKVRITTKQNPSHSRPRL